jgi:hypothetical protein
MNELTGMLCLGGILLFPVMTFVLGFLAGRNRLPYSIRIERNRPKEYAVDDEGEVNWEEIPNP